MMSAERESSPPTGAAESKIRCQVKEIEGSARIDEINREIFCYGIESSEGSAEEDSNGQYDALPPSPEIKAKIYDRIQCCVLRSGNRCPYLLTHCHIHTPQLKKLAVKNRDVKEVTQLLVAAYKSLEERANKNTDISEMEFDSKVHCGEKTKNGMCMRFLLRCPHMKRKLKKQNGTKKLHPLLQNFIPDLINISPTLGLDIDSNQSSEDMELHQKPETENPQLQPEPVNQTDNLSTTNNAKCGKKGKPRKREADNLFEAEFERCRHQLEVEAKKKALQH